MLQWHVRQLKLLYSRLDLCLAWGPHAADLLPIFMPALQVGSIQPIAEIAAVASARGVLVHCDAAQSVGKVALDVQQLGLDMMTLVGHKFGAPKGVAALYIRCGLCLYWRCRHVTDTCLFQIVHDLNPKHILPERK